MFSTGNSTQYAIMAYMGKEPKKKRIQPETNTIVFINYTPKNIKNTKQKNTF